MLLSVTSRSRVFARYCHASKIEETIEKLNEQLKGEKGETISLRSLEITEMKENTDRLNSGFVLVKAIIDIYTPSEQSRYPLSVPGYPPVVSNS